MPEQPRRDFTGTRWSLVLRAAGEPSAATDEALSTLYTTYWESLYAFLRKRGHSQEQAQELIQEFWVFLLEKKTLGRANRLRGRFRSFLFTSLNNFVINEHERATAQKRDPGVPVLSLEITTAEGRFQLEPPSDETPEKIFDRRWALTLLRCVFNTMRREMSPEGARRFEHLKRHIPGGKTEGGYARTAALLGMSEAAVRTETSRLRDRFEELVREEIAHTVSTPDEIEDEIRHLLSAVRR